MNTHMMKQLFAGFLVLHCCLAFNYDEPSLASGHDYSQHQQHHSSFFSTKWLNFQVNYLRSLVRSLFQSLTALTAAVADMKPKCPSTAPADAEVLGTYCYWIGTTALTLGAASDSCRAAGGTLAEPLPAFGPPLRTALQNAFPDKFTTIGLTSNLWLGIDNYNDNGPGLGTHWLFLTTNQQVPDPATIGSGQQYGRLLQTGGTFGSDAASTPHYYVCQSTAL